VRRFEDPIRPSCEVCQEIYRKKGVDPPCEGCFPTLTEENQLLFQVYQQVSGQVVTVGMGEVLDLNINAVEIVFDYFDIPRGLRLKYLRRLMSMFRTRLVERKEEEQTDG